MLGFTGTPLTALLYSGELTDAATGQQYLRARYYDPASGRLNRVDPFGGSHTDPLSFNKYLYTHGNPVNNIDPTGLRSLGELLTVVRIQTQTLAPRVKQGLRITTQAFKVIVRAAMIANLIQAGLDPRLTFWAALATNYNWSEIRKFGRIPVSRLQKFTIKRILKIATIAADTYVLVERARIRGDRIPIKPTGFPDFGEHVHPVRGTVFIKLTGFRNKDSRRADAARGLPRPRGWVWHHHEVLGIMQLIPQRINNPSQGGLSHTGGAFFWTITNNVAEYG